MREDVAFKALDGTPLAAFLYPPDRGDSPFPAIVLSHGFGAVKEMALDRYADLVLHAHTPGPSPAILNRKPPLP